MPHPLPKVTEDFLKYGAPKGQRNDALKDAACQIRDARYTEDQCLSLVGPICEQIGLPAVEVRKTVNSIFSQPPRDPIKDGQAAPAERRRERYTYRNDRKPPASMVSRPLATPAADDTPIPIPEPLPDGARLLITTLFREKEEIRIVKGVKGEDGHEHPRDEGSFQDREVWLKLLDKYDGKPSFFTTDDGSGIYIGINPTGGPRDSDVTAYRHCLLEWDDLPLDQQWTLIVKNKLPCAAVVHSGGRSLHAVVRVNAENADQFQERVEILQAHFKATGIDPQNKGPARLTRWPECPRGAAVQKLLAVNIGPPDFATWWDDVNTPERLEIDSMADFDPLSDPNSVLGQRWLCRKAMAILQGQSGIGKSSLLMQMAVSWALNKDFYGIRSTRPLKSLIVQAENDTGDMSEMFQGVCEKLGYPLRNEDGTPHTENRNYFRQYIDIRREACKTSDVFIEMMHRLIIRTKPDIVWADPLLTYIGDDVSKQVVVSHFLRSMLNPIIEATGVIWIWAHHTPKPSTDSKSKAHWTEKDMAYSGFGSSELVNAPRETITLYHPGYAPAGVFALTTSKRSGSGMQDKDGKFTKTIFLKHCEDRRTNGSKIIFWERSDYDPNVKPPRKPKAQDDDPPTGAPPEASAASQKKPGRPAEFEFPIDEFLATLAGRAVKATLIEEEIRDMLGCSPATANRHWLKTVRQLLAYDPETKLYSLKPTTNA